MTVVDADWMKLWQVLAEFFSDAEFSPATFDLAARTIQQNSYTFDQAHSIL